ncbi:MAG: O-antigen ligase family protein [Candidatus Omnitrophica bacterium]|nr:O-antigen ligase family protein [Candidatus Omnitrophota bacterium]
MNSLEIKNQELQNSFKNNLLLVIIISFFSYLVIKEVSLPKLITVPLAILALTALIFSSFKKPIFTLLIFSAYLPFSKILIGKLGMDITGFNLSNIILFIVILGWISYVSNTGQSFFSKSSLNPVVLLFCLWGLFSVIRSKFIYGNDYSLEDFFILFKRWITPIFLYFIGLNMVRDKGAFKKVMFVMGAVTFIVALMAIRDYIQLGDAGSLDESRIGGVFEQPNTLGAFFVYNMFFFLGFFLYYWRSFKYWLLLVPFIACFRGIMVTFSRGAYISFGFGGLMASFFRSKVLFICVSFLLIAAILMPGVLPSGVRYRLASTFGGEKIVATEVEEITDPSAGRRIVIWKGAIEMIKAQPLFGFGYGTFTYIIGNYVPEAPNMDAHNTYLILAAEMGIPSLVLFLIILLLLIKNAAWLLRNSKDKYFKAFALGVLGGVFGLLVANMFGSRLNSEEVSSYFWLYTGLTMAAVRMKKLNKIQ